MVQLNIGLMIFLVTLEYARGRFPCPDKHSLGPLFSTIRFLFSL